MSPQSQTATLVSTFFSTEAFQSIAMELAIFCATIVVAVVLKVSSFSGCNASFFRFWPSQGPPTSKACASDECQQPIKEAPPIAKPPRHMQACSAGKPASNSALKTTASILETIMDRASNKSGKSAEEALSLYADFQSSDVKLPMQALLRCTRHSGLDFYSALLQCAVRIGQPQMVEQLLDDMSSSCIERTLSFYESAMKVLAGKKHCRETLAVYNRLSSEGLKASPVTLSCLIHAAVELGDLDSAIGFFEQLSSTATPSIRAYMMALRVHSKRQNWTKSLEVFRDMQARSVPIDSLILNAVLATGVSCGHIAATEALLNEMTKTHTANGDAVVDVISYNTVLKGYAHQKVADGALKLLDLMLERGLKPNGITFNTVMDSVVRGPQPDDAFKVLERMRKAGIRPDKFTCTTVLKALHEESTPKQLSMVIEVVQSALPLIDSSQLRSSLFHGIIAAAARLNNTSLLMQAFTQMQGRNIATTAADYKLVIQVLAQQGEAEYCSTIWRRVVTSARGKSGIEDKQHKADIAAIFSAVMDDLADKDDIEGMICAFESLRAAVMVDEAEKHCSDSHGSLKALEENRQYILQRCSSALMQAASRKQRSNPALRRLLELAPEYGITEIVGASTRT